MFNLRGYYAIAILLILNQPTMPFIQPFIRMNQLSERFNNFQMNSFSGFTSDSDRRITPSRSIISSNFVPTASFFKSGSLLSSSDSESTDSFMGSKSSLTASSAEISEENMKEDLKYLEQQFCLLSGNSNGEISWNTFMHWEEIQSLIVDGYCTIDDVKEAWKKGAGTFRNPINLNDFIAINRYLDEMVDSDEKLSQELADDMDSSLLRNLNDKIIKDEELIDDSKIKKLSDKQYRTKKDLMNYDSYDDEDDNELEETDIFNTSDDDEDSYEMMSQFNIDPWDPTFDPAKIFDDIFLEYLTTFFKKNCQKTKSKSKKILPGMLAYEKFVKWPDIQQMVDEGQVDMTCLSDLWVEALVEYQWKYRQDDSNMKKMPTIDDGMDLPTFLRMNVRLDMIMDEIDDALSKLTNEEIQSYYREAFSNLTQNQTLLSYGDLLRWDDIQDLLQKGILNMTKLNQLWQALPKQPLGMYVRVPVDDDRQNGKSQQKTIQSEGITVDAFIMLNEAIDDIQHAETIE